MCAFASKNRDSNHSIPCVIMPLKNTKGGGIVAIENGEWIMRGLEWDDPARIQSWEELID